MSEPTLSVVIPTYNRRDSLRVTLEGMKQQTYSSERFEVIVISDGSTDGTDALLAEYVEQVPFRLRPILQQNAGPSRARNRGIREATGDVIVFLDDDVEPAPDFLKNHAAHHAKDSDTVAIGPLLQDPARRRQEPLWIVWEHRMLEKQYTAVREDGRTQSPAGPNHFYSGNASIRREHLLAIGGFDEQFTRQEDVELAYRLRRERNIHFVIDMEAVGIHRPLRTFASWLKIPYAYGRLDVVRAQRGDAEWSDVRHGYISRSRLTRTLADITLAAPALGAPLRSLLRGVSSTAYRLSVDKLAFGVLSALYNVHYIEGARDEMGTKELRELFRGFAPLDMPPVPQTAQASE